MKYYIISPTFKKKMFLGSQFKHLHFVPHLSKLRIIHPDFTEITGKNVYSCSESSQLQKGGRSITENPKKRNN